MLPLPPSLVLPLIIHRTCAPARAGQVGGQLHSNRWNHASRFLPRPPAVLRCSVLDLNNPKFLALSLFQNLEPVLGCPPAPSSPLASRSSTRR